jgi:HSP20 family molecular chaperone IbpA
MLTRYHEPFFSTALDLFPDVMWSSSKRSDTIDKDGLKIELPGVKPSDLDVVVEGKSLLVKGKSRLGKDFSYSYSLSSKVNIEGIVAKFADGLLEISLPKKEIETQTRRINIQT